MPLFGATRQAAEIESSKIFAKDLMQRYRIPCAGSASFSSYTEASEYVLNQSPPIVVKADGLAAGKGVVVAQTVKEALDALDQFMQQGSLGEAGEKVIIEEYLAGREMSAFAFTDAHSVVMATYACDYKRVSDGDLGPNTGGMGGYSPPHFLNDALSRQVFQDIMQPTVRALHDEGRNYRGVLYGGLMVADNQAKVLEFNARFGDPETQVILPRLKTDLVDIMLAIDERRLDRMPVEWTGDACVGVVLASGGYPGHYETGFPISGLDSVDKDIMVFHAGTKPSPGGQALTNGGRVLNVTGFGKNLTQAIANAYLGVSKIHFKGANFRRDIGQKALG